MGDQVDGLIVLFDLEHVGMHHLWKPGQYTTRLVILLLSVIVL